MPGSTSRDSHPRLSSADIVAVTTEMRLRQQGRKNRPAKKGKDDTDDAKRELVMEEHKQSAAELFADLGSDPVNVSFVPCPPLASPIHAKLSGQPF